VYLRHKIIGGSAEGPCCRVDTFCKAEVGGLEVTVDDTESVQVVQSKCDLCGVECRDRIGESLKSELAEKFYQAGYVRRTLDLRRSVNSSSPGTKSMTI
jgi:hypothetical protein